MSEKAFNKLNLSQKVFDISFDVEENQEEFVNQKLLQIVQKENLISGEMDTYYLKANYTLLETEKNRIQTGNVILGSLTVIILLVGIMNYTNTSEIIRQVLRLAEISNYLCFSSQSYFQNVFKNRKSDNLQIKQLHFLQSMLLHGQQLHHYSVPGT